MPPDREKPRKPDSPTALTSSAPFGNTARNRVGLFGSRSFKSATSASWTVAFTGMVRSVSTCESPNGWYSIATGIDAAWRASQTASGLVPVDWITPSGTRSPSLGSFCMASPGPAALSWTTRTGWVDRRRTRQDSRMVATTAIAATTTTPNSGDIGTAYVERATIGRYVGCPQRARTPGLAASALMPRECAAQGPPLARRSSRFTPTTRRSRARVAGARPAARGP